MYEPLYIDKLVAISNWLGPTLIMKGAGRTGSIVTKYAKGGQYVGDLVKDAVNRFYYGFPS